MSDSYYPRHAASPAKPEERSTDPEAEGQGRSPEGVSVALRTVEGAHVTSLRFPPLSAGHVSDPYYPRHAGPLTNPGPLVRQPADTHPRDNLESDADVEIDRLRARLEASDQRERFWATEAAQEQVRREASERRAAALRALLLRALDGLHGGHTNALYSLIRDALAEAR